MFPVRMEVVFSLPSSLLLFRLISSIFPTLSFFYSSIPLPKLKRRTVITIKRCHYVLFPLEYHFLEGSNLLTLLWLSFSIMFWASIIIWKYKVCFLLIFIDSTVLPQGRHSIHFYQMQYYNHRISETTEVQGTCEMRERSQKPVTANARIL